MPVVTDYEQMKVMTHVRMIRDILMKNGQCSFAFPFLAGPNLRIDKAQAGEIMMSSNDEWNIMSSTQALPTFYNRPSGVNCKRYSINKD